MNAKFLVQVWTQFPLSTGWDTTYVGSSRWKAVRAYIAGVKTGSTTRWTRYSE
ncbi:hypothetical protein BH766_gp48 [Gordonia phage Demosthenes]|uniref:Uncharacterized protein n=1 Tax=Gordonia phage Demosthenes TaxID=1838067 RepID=A0A160DE05_9CAUD|nr:hypothetical protein BH766_gp48 [Gordonia phage Demosthenes]ANA86018.1 hypothetical protein PBI_DEMOSTHENES_48 [Gordonia phage Demosthenes]